MGILRLAVQRFNCDRTDPNRDRKEQVTIMSIKITLDPGHGRTGNPYPPQKGYYEGAQMWKLANFLKTELEKYGFDVVTTRPRLDDDPSLTERGQTAGQNGSMLFLSLHSNAPASASDTKPTGTEIYYSMADSDNKFLADRLGERIAVAMNHPYRGSRTRTHPTQPGVDYYGVIRESARSGCKRAFLIEHGFHTNLKDSAFLIDDENLKKLAIEEAHVIAHYLGQKPIETPQQETARLYRVQTGAFRNKANAERQAEKLRQAGFPVYIYEEPTL